MQMSDCLSVCLSMVGFITLHYHWFLVCFFISDASKIYYVLMTLILRVYFLHFSIFLTFYWLFLLRLQKIVFLL